MRDHLASAQGIALELLAEHDYRHAGSLLTCKACVVARAFVSAYGPLVALNDAANIYGTAYLKDRREPDGTSTYEVLTTEVVEVREPAPKENP